MLKQQPNKLKDSELVHSLMEGSSYAFNEFFERYFSVLYTFTFYRLKDKEATSDLLQSVFANLWEKRAEINVRGEFQTYIFTIVRNRIYNHYRRAKVSQRYLDNFQKYIDNIEDNTDHLIRRKELSELIEEAIMSLPDNLRITFELSRNSNLTRKELAEKLNLTEEGVKTRMHRALKILKIKLGPHYHLLFLT